MVFSILIHNTDDHLRHHGFLIEPQGITLSPAFDLNPSVDRNELTLAINEVDTTCNVEIAMEAHQTYGLTASEAKLIISTTRKAVSSWRSRAAKLRIPTREQVQMGEAFSENTGL